MDADLHAIYRRRRQEGRCVRCGVACGRTVLCATCGADWRYCSRCEAVYPRTVAYVRQSEPWRRSSEHCRECRKARYEVEKQRPPRRYQKKHPRADELAQHYTRGATLMQIALATGLGISTVKQIIRIERMAGRWPRDLWRGKDWRKGQRNV